MWTISNNMGNPAGHARIPGLCLIPGVWSRMPKSVTLYRCIHCIHRSGAGRAAVPKPHLYNQRFLPAPLCRACWFIDLRFHFWLNKSCLTMSRCANLKRGPGSEWQKHRAMSCDLDRFTLSHIPSYHLNTRDGFFMQQSIKDICVWKRIYIQSVF